MKYERVPTNDANDHNRTAKVAVVSKDDHATAPTTPVEAEKASVSAPKSPNVFARLLIVFVAVLVVFCLWAPFTLLETIKSFHPHRHCGQKHDEILTSTNGQSDVSYVQLQSLPLNLIPSQRNPNTNRKLVFIGDVHGARNELQALLTKLDGMGHLSNSHIIFTGDMITKGPHSLEVLDMAIALNASCVRGNHEDTVMQQYYRLVKEGKIIQNSNGENEVIDDQPESDTETHQKHDHHAHDVDAAKESKKRHKHDGKHDKKPKKKGQLKKHIKLAKRLKTRHVKYIESCPLILKIDDVSGVGDIAVVHAGMIPGVPLSSQLPSVLMNLRTFVKKLPTSSRSGVHWSRLWNEYQNMLVRQNKRPLTIVYGHDARRGLEIKPYSKGLDSNCVRGGRLTALVVHGGKHPKSSIVSVKGKNYVRKN